MQSDPTSKLQLMTARDAGQTIDDVDADELTPNKPVVEKLPRLELTRSQFALLVTKEQRSWLERAIEHNRLRRYAEKLRSKTPRPQQHRLREALREQRVQIRQLPLKARIPAINFAIDLTRTHANDLLRDLSRELQANKSPGPGRPAEAHTPELTEEVRQRYANGESMRAIARDVGTSRYHVRRILKEHDS